MRSGCWKPWNRWMHSGFRVTRGHRAPTGGRRRISSAAGLARATRFSILSAGSVLAPEQALGQPAQPVVIAGQALQRSEERRVGKESGSRGPPDEEINKV